MEAVLIQEFSTRDLGVVTIQVGDIDNVEIVGVSAYLTHYGKTAAY